MNRGNSGSLRERVRLPAVVTVVAVVAGVVVAVSGAASQVPGMRFLPAGTWVYNSVLRGVYHIDGGTGNVDERIALDAGEGAQVVQGDTTTVVVSDDIHRLNPSTLEVLTVEDAPAAEKPVALEAPGGPYVVYPNSGAIIRYGELGALIQTEVPLGAPVVTSDGTLWVHQPSKSQVCSLAPDRVELDCRVKTATGAAGALTVVADVPVFVDLSTDKMHTIGERGLGEGVAIGVDLPSTARLAGSDVGGRVAVLDPENDRMHLVGAGVPPTPIPLPQGNYTAPESTGDVVAVVDQESDTLLVFDGTGGERATKPLPAERGEPTVHAGQDGRLYVKGGQGQNVMVVDQAGGITEVPVDGVDATTTQTTGTSTTATTTSTTTSTTTPLPNPGTGSDSSTSAADPPPTRERRTAVPPPTAPASPPGAPPGVRASAGDRSATVTWQAAAANRSPITGYRITWPGGSTDVGPGSRQVTARGLANGTSYALTVAAINAAGIGPGTRSNAVTPAVPAGAPTNLAVTPSPGEAAVTWRAPAMGGGQFVHYRVSATGITARTTTGTSITLTGLPTDRNVTITVVAVTKVQGRTVDGGTASTTIEQSGPRVTVTRGSTEAYDGCEVPECGLMRVTMTGFQPDTRYNITPHSTDTGYSNEGHGETTDSSGNGEFEAFHYEGVDERVWVEVRLDGELVATSERYTWRSG